MMSSALGLVRFEDGDIWVCVYNGTVDLVQPPLGRSWDTMFASRKSLGPSGVDDVDDEAVLIYTYYGGGMLWPARASRGSRPQITDQWSPWLETHEITGEVIVPAPAWREDGIEPEWVKEWVKKDQLSD